MTLDCAPETTANAGDPMARALALASTARGFVSPNPAVGAVLVRDGVIVGEGCTEPPGGRHAEIVALDAAGEAARNATLYVTLEPCSHYGRTPPCTDALIRAGVQDVIYAIQDPDRRVDGDGLAQLTAAGVTVSRGSHAAETETLLADYIKHRKTGLPLVIAKFAASLDGKIGTHTGDSRWISGPDTLAWAHQERARLDAIAVGVNTVVVDNPQLTARPGGSEGDSRQPLRVVIDTRGRTPLSAKVLQGPARTLIATTELAPAEWRTAVEALGTEVAVLGRSGDHVDLRQLLVLLGQRNCLNLLVEGGGIVLGSFFDQGLVDRVQAILAPMIIGGAGAPVAIAGRGVARMADALRLERMTVRRLGVDILIEGLVPNRG